ncbi:hypothetical protein [Alkalihalobacillus sp. 1P02AB]|uniref:hypothetical protein n=1 Tax=Alkalihalobacillus sp. 1P02AB TaxID=3132260 RepID=UPI0039A780CD
MNRKSRRIFEYMTVEQKKEAVLLLKKDRDELSSVFEETRGSYPTIVKQVIIDSLDKWELEIEELELDIKNNVGAINN